MSSYKKIQPKDIIKTAFEILIKKGIEGVNAREIAKRLNISVQPIFYQFNNMEELKKELLKYAHDYYKKYILGTKDSGLEYKQIGINYIKLAKDKPNLFKYLFMRNYHIKIEQIANFDESYTQVKEVLSTKRKISKEEANKMHLKMWMFTHGISCLIATGTCEFSEEEINNLLTEEFQALMFDTIKNKQ